MSYRVRHLTEYMYSDAVSTSHHELHLLPRETPGQIVRDEALTVTPEPALRRDRVDWFGNPSTHLAIHARHTRLAVTSTFIVDIAREPPPDDDGSWEAARDWVRAGADAEARADLEMALPSPRVRPVGGGARVRRAVVHAGPSPRRGGARSDAPDPHRVHLRPGRDRRRDVRSTRCCAAAAASARTSRTSCSPACAPSASPPATSAATWSPTTPAEREPTLVGADASHAWVSVRLPGGAWLDLDPDQRRHPDRPPHRRRRTAATSATSRPMRGVLLGGGRHELIVGVDVAPISGDPEDG